MINFNRLLIGFFALFIVQVNSAFAANKNVGTSGASFLRIGSGPRPTAMGEAFVAIADDINTVHHNPAGLALIEESQMTAMHTQWFQNLNYDFGAFAVPTGIGTFAISAATLKASDIQKRGNDESDLGTFENLDAAYALSYGRNIIDNLAAGVTLRYIKEEIDTESAQAMSGDLGLRYQMASRPLSFGFAVRHFGPEIKFIDESDPQPLTFDVGAAHRFFSDKLVLATDLRKPRDNDVQYGFGAEYIQPIGKDFSTALRAGYSSETTGPDGAHGISLGAGVGIKQLELNFAWVPFGDLGNTFRYGALFRF
ncbi:MAG: PorV/PorQ family protein [Elusimicrobiota bacterium]